MLIITLLVSCIIEFMYCFPEVWSYVCCSVTSIKSSRKHFLLVFSVVGMHRQCLQLKVIKLGMQAS